MAYWPFRHLGLKILAIALASLLWLTVAGEHVVERSMRVPLELQNLDGQLEIVGDLPATVDVRLRGSSAILRRLDPGDISAILDLVAARPGSRLFPLRPEDIRVPFGVEVAQVTPPMLSMEVETQSRRTVPVVPALECDPAPGYVVGRVSSDPATVQIVGPERRVRDVPEATTEPVVIEGSQGRIRDIVTVGVRDAAIRLAEPQRAAVVVEIWPAPVERELAGVPVRWRNLGDGLRAQLAPSVASVAIRGQRAALAGVGPSAIDAFVDLAGLGPGRYNLRVQVAPSAEFGVRAVAPGAVHVTIRPASQDAPSTVRN
jgi:YbbR domain-containing protein